MNLLYKQNKVILDNIQVKRVKEAVVDHNWHLHDEIEIVYINKGRGTRWVGDSFASFNFGELVIVGSCLPHLWRTDEKCKNIDQIIIKFRKPHNNAELFLQPEFSLIRKLLNKAEVGVAFGRQTQKQVTQHFEKIADAESVMKWSYLINILDILSKSTDIKILSNPLVKLPDFMLEDERLNKIFSFVVRNYSKDISLSEISDISSMTITSFCRFFRVSTKTTFIDFLNRYRIDKACYLLINNELPINTICYATGFKSIANFNRTFKNYINLTPKEYRKKLLRNPSQF